MRDITKLKLADDRYIDLPSDKKGASRFVADAISNGGWTSEGRLDYASFADTFFARDAVTSTEIRPFLQSTFEFILREPVDPLMVITGLFTRVQAKGLEVKVLAGAMGAVEAYDVPEGGTYPEVMFQVGGGMQTAWIGKSGVACSFTDEALRYSTWDIMAMNLRAMRSAMIRHKEGKAVNVLRSLGTELFNNATPATSVFGVMTGRGIDMAANGSLAQDDLFKAMAFGAEQGFPYDTMLVNPQFFFMGIQDPVLRNMYLAHGGGSYFQNWSGNAGPLDPWSNGSMGGMGPTQGNRIVPGGNAAGELATGIAGREHGMTSTPPLPMGYFPWPFRVIVSPLIPFDADSQLGDIYMLSSGNVGYHLVDEELTQVEWRQEDREQVKVKLRERYGFAIAQEGLGVGVMKNVKLARNYWDGTVKAATLEVDSEIDSNAVIAI